MPRIRFTADYDWKPLPSVTVAYSAGWSGVVTRACAEAARAAGKASGEATGKAENYAPPEGGADAGRTDAPTAGVGEA